LTGQFDIVQSILLGGTDTTDQLTGPHRRLVDAWRSEADGNHMRGDVAALLRQVLINQGATTGFPNPRLELDLVGRGIDVDAVAHAHLRITRFGATHHVVTLGDAWQPDWLLGDPQWINLACASPGPFVQEDHTKVSTYARPDSRVPVDPAVRAIAPSIDHYRSRTQATAVRTATLINPDSTLHVVLPTGTGKSIVGLAPGLLRSRGTTLVVVPTIALALDQERQIRARFPNSALPYALAYYGDRDELDKAAIKQRLRDGIQRILFTSPEALVSALAPALRALAATGGLAHVVIDEAHLVRTWGLDFRPEFQIVASLLAELRDIARGADKQPPRVALLTATLSEQGLRLNDSLFAGEANSVFVGSTFLRTELRYLLGRTTTQVDRASRVVEALHHLPRPAIIYTTRKGVAELIAAQLREAGFIRTAVVHGDVNSSTRLDVLRGWSGDGEPTAFDVVVGTSAFGLGVDQSDVRTVVHACAPASVDRFYQEVGRAGRDGHAALSVWLPADGDVEDGQKIERSTLIGNKKAWARWDAMRLKHRADPSGRRLILDTGVVPPHSEFTSDKNRLWNRNTLVLMERAGLIDIKTLDPPVVEREPGELEDAFRNRLAKVWEEFVRLVPVRVAAGVTNLDQQTFDQAMSRVRAEIKGSESASIAQVGRLLALRECWGRVLAEEYTYADFGPMQATQRVAQACSGCPASEHIHELTYRAARPLVSEAPMPVLGLAPGKALQRLAAGTLSVVVTYPDGGLAMSLGSLVQGCVTAGVRAIVASTSVLTRPAISDAAKYAEEGIVLVDRMPAGRLPPPRLAVPTLIVLDNGDPPPLSWLTPTEGPLRVVVVPAETRDPAYPDDLVKTVRSPHWGIDDFVRRL
jgi:superfamily II DNA/RNA helicase